MRLVAQLVRAELLKVRTTRVAWALLGSMALLVAALVSLTVANQSVRELSGDHGLRTVLPLGAALAYLFTLALGIIGMAGEYRHGTIGHVLLAAPRRREAIAAKLLAYFVIGLVFAGVAVALSFAIAGPWMSSKGVEWSLGDTLALEILAGSLLGSALFATIGVGLGALLRDQVLALFVGVGWTLLLDSLVNGVLPEVGRFLPGGAFAAFTRQAQDELLGWAEGGLLLLLYTAILAAAGAIALQRRDLT